MSRNALLIQRRCAWSKISCWQKVSWKKSKKCSSRTKEWLASSNSLALRPSESTDETWRETQKARNFALSCRLYPGSKQIGLPPEEMIHRALIEALQEDRA